MFLTSHHIFHTLLLHCYNVVILILLSSSLTIVYHNLFIYNYSLCDSIMKVFSFYVIFTFTIKSLYPYTTLTLLMSKVIPQQLELGAFI